MSISYKVEAVPITAVRDRAMFNTFAGNKSYIIKDIGDELEVTYASNSFIVSLGTGEAVICGGSMLSEGQADEITLGASESGYIVVEIDLAQVGDNICQFKKVSSLVQGNINNGDMVYDFPLYQYETDASGVHNIEDVRVIYSRPDGDKQDIITAGRGINISGVSVSNVFENLSAVDLNNIKYQFHGYVSNITANYPSGNSITGELLVLAGSGANKCVQFYSPYNSNKLFMRTYDTSWTNWEEITGKQNTLTASTGINIASDSISVKFSQYTGDLNSLTYAFVGYATNSATNKPASSGGQIIVAINNDGSSVMQIFSTYNSRNVYIRHKANGSWTAWAQIAFDTIIGGNLNNIQGNYFGYCDDATTNKPTDHGGGFVSMMYAIASSAYGAQLFASAVASEEGLYYRRRSNSSWGGWRELTDAYEKDDTFATSGTYTPSVAGFAYSSSKTLRFWYPLDKPVNATGFTLTNLTLSARGDQGLILENVALRTNGTTASGYTISSSISNGGINILVSRDTAFSVTNQRPIVITPSLSGTFS